MNAHDRLGKLIGQIRDAAAARDVFPNSQDLDVQIHALEKSLKRPIPPSVRRLLLEVTPPVWESGLSGDCIRLLELSELEWVSSKELADYTPDDRVNDADHFGFAAGIFGDTVCLRYLAQEEREVVLLNHEGGSYVYLARSLTEWIERLIEFNGIDYGYMSGGIENLEKSRRRDVLEYHRQLNPQLEWAARGLSRLDLPDGDPAGYLHWNGASLVPIALAGDVQSIHLTDGTDRDLESIASAGKYRKLSISKGRIHTFAPLRWLESLEALTLYDVQEFDCTTLNGHPQLVQIYGLRCGFKNLAELATLPSFKLLRDQQCRLDQDEWGTLARRRPDIKRTR